MGKPENAADAIAMLGKLSGTVHQVYTGVTLAHGTKAETFFDLTDVRFRELTAGEIEFYVTHYKPFDKAGSYGIQDWLGFIGVVEIKGSYTNVMGLPTEKLYSALSKF